MASTETDITQLTGFYRDVLLGGDGRVAWDSGERKNLIVTNCRVLLASFMRGAPDSAGIQSLKVGIGDASWDSTPTPPIASQTALVDSNPYTVPAAELAFSYLSALNGTPVPGPTNIVQIRATFGPNVPPWPDATHPTSTLREFALFGRLDGADWMINSVRHPAIVKDPVSTLNRTLWLVF
ncbi:hypothetical protein WME94_33600 [Sorangium sp. So ce429]